MRGYAQRLLVWGGARQLGVDSLPTAYFAESFDVCFTSLAASVWGVCGLLDLAAVFYFLRLDFGLVVSDSLARRPSWRGFTGRCICVGHILRASLVECHPSAQQRYGAEDFEVWDIVRLILL